MLPKYHKLMGYDVTVIASLMSFDKHGNYCFLKSPAEYISNDGFKVIRLNYRKRLTSLFRILKSYEKTYFTIEKENPSIIFIHGCQFLDIRQVLKYKKSHPYTKIFIDNHSDFINSGSNWLSKNVLHKIIWRYLVKKIEPFTERFYGVTPLRCDFLKNTYHVSENKIDLLVLGADDEKINFNEKDILRGIIRKSINIGEEDFVIVTGGKINKQKNIHLLLQAVTELKNDRVVLILFGTSNLQMKQVIDELSKSSRIKNIGWIDSAKAYDYFLASDLAVFPGTHSVLWEQSVGCGTPGVFKYWPGMDHINVGGNCRFLYKDSVDEIKCMLEEIINNKDIYKRMKEISMELGVKNFSYRRLAIKAIQS